MKAFALSAGRRAAAAGVAGAAATSSQPSAHAREVVQQAPAAANARAVGKLEDQDWLLTDFDQEVLVFKPFKACEVDAAVDQVHAMMEGKGRRSTGVVIEELDPAASGTPTPASEAESFVSMGADADAVLSQSASGSMMMLGGGAAGGAMRQLGTDSSMPDLLKIASKLLKRPGLQTEVFKCMLEDKEVRDLMLKQSCNLDAYLEAVGVHNPRLLPGLSSAMEEGEEEGSEAGEGNKNPVLQGILNAVAKCIDKTGSWLQGMGGWLRDRAAGLGSHFAAMFGGGEETEETEGQQRREHKARPAVDAVLGAVMVATVAVFCVLLARSPGVIRGVASATAAAAAAGQANKRARIPT